MIYFWHGLQEGPVLDSFKQIVQEYNFTHKAQVELKNFDKYGLPAEVAFGKPEADQPSLILAPEFQTAFMATKLKEGRVLPIGDLLDPAKLNDIADIVKRTFGDREGNLSSLPMNPSCGVLFMNQDLLAQTGKEPPRSIEELESICKELMQKNLVESGWTSAWPAAYLVEIPAAQQDLALVEPKNGQLGPSKYCLSKPWLIQHFLDLRGQQKAGIFRYAGQTNDAKKPFTERKVAFFMQGSTHQPILEKECPFKVVAAPLPTLTRHSTDKFAFPMGGAAIWVLNNAQTREMIEQVKSFLNYLAGKEFQERWHKETAYVPVNKTLPKSLEAYYQNHPLHKAVVEQTLEATLGEHSFGIHASNWSEARKELFALIEKILDPNLPDDQIQPLLEAFDKKYSDPQ